MSEAWKKWEGRTLAEKYPLRRYLGGSSRSAVFQTEYASRDAAIKLIAADAASAEQQLRRLNQTARLDHPHLARLLAWGRGEMDGTSLLYVVMEYAEESLSEILPDRALTTKETRAMLGPVLNALAFLRSRGLVHGRVQPSNILAVGDRVKLSSDSIATSGERDPSAPTPTKYDAPERTTAGPAPESDMWALGVTLVEVLTQRAPAGGTAEKTPLLPDAVPAPFFELVRHFLEPNPARRWTAAQAAARLQPPGTASVRRAAAASRPAPPRRSVLPALAIAALLLLVVVAVSQWLKRAPDPEMAVAPDVAEENAAAEEPPPPESAPPPGARPATLSESPVPQPPARTAEAPAVSVVRGEVTRRVLPPVPQSALDTIRGTVRVGVRVAVSPEGNVTAAELDPAGPSRYFARLSMEAAQQWEFTPAQVAGRNVESEWLLRFEYTNDEARAIPVPEVP